MTTLEQYEELAACKCNALHAELAHALRALRRLARYHLLTGGSYAIAGDDPVDSCCEQYLAATAEPEVTTDDHAS
jgi:hypothetical protein